MEKSKKALQTTFGITFVLFAFIIFLLYVIYCYAYYDEYNKQVFTDKVNDREYSFIYSKLVGKGNLTYEEFNSSLDLFTNKDSVLNIYDSYYKECDTFTEEEFLDTYYFKDLKVKSDDIVFGTNGKTNLVNRKAIFYDEIKISNKNNNTSIGVFNKISFKIEDNAVLRINSKELECTNNTCVVDKMYGGIHELSYISNGYEYYGLVNINKDKLIVNVSNLDSLIKVREYKIELKYGKYSINKCNLDNIDSCASMSKSYLILNEDNTFVLYLYHTSLNRGVITDGTYSVLEDKITLNSYKYGKEVYTFDGINLVGDNTSYNYSFVG